MATVDHPPFEPLRMRHMNRRPFQPVDRRALHNPVKVEPAHRDASPPGGQIGDRTPEPRRQSEGPSPRGSTESSVPAFFRGLDRLSVSVLCRVRRLFHGVLLWLRTQLTGQAFHGTASAPSPERRIEHRSPMRSGRKGAFLRLSLCAPDLSQLQSWKGHRLGSAGSLVTSPFPEGTPARTFSSGFQRSGRCPDRVDRSTNCAKVQQRSDR